MRDQTLAALLIRMTATTPRFPPARLLDGKRIAEDLLDNLQAQVALRVAAGKSRPGLAVVLVGNDPASSVYVKNKRRAAHKVGIRAIDYDLPADTGDAELLALIDRLNADPQVHGILVQLPLPDRRDATQLIHRIDPGKDVDGFHPENVGHLALRQFGLRPCTPRGITTLLGYTDRPVRGQSATIVGVSNHVGRPMAPSQRRPRAGCRGLGGAVRFLVGGRVGVSTLPRSNVH